jgi:hypothetical protein
MRQMRPQHAQKQRPYENEHHSTERQATAQVGREPPIFREPPDQRSQGAALGNLEAAYAGLEADSVG